MPYEPIETGLVLANNALACVGTLEDDAQKAEHPLALKELREILTKLDGAHSEEVAAVRTENAALRLPLMQCVAILEEFDPAEMPDREDASAVEQAKQIVRWAEAINGGNDALGQPQSVDWRVAAADAEDLAESEDGDGEEADG